MGTCRQHPRQMSILAAELQTRELHKAAHFEEQMERVEAGEMSLLNAFAECNRHDSQIDAHPLTTEVVKRKRNNL